MMNKSKKRQYFSAILTALIGLGWLIGSILGLFSTYGFAVVFMISVALIVMNSPLLKSYAFTAWVLVCVSFAMVYPNALQEWRGVKLTLLIVPLVQIIMFGMGTTLSLKDFTNVLLAPWSVFVGLFLQFCIMPVVGFMVATCFGFEGELAAGIVLIGSVSGGVASNLMAYIAGANVALSVTMTCVSTLAAPLMTPLLMRLFAGRFVPIDVFAMMLSILNMILVPVIAGLIAHSILYGDSKWTKKLGRLSAIFVIAIAVVWAVAASNPSSWSSFVAIRSGIVLGSLLIAMVIAAKAVISIMLKRGDEWMDRVLPIVSMFGICAILSIIIAQTYDVLLQAGVMLIFAAIIHNAVGYGLGYWGARWFGVLIAMIGYRLKILNTTTSVITEADCRTVAFEVGMQNGGMATGLAIDVLNSHLAALPPNVFGTWMNISGSILANRWKKTKILKK